MRATIFIALIGLLVLTLALMCIAKDDVPDICEIQLRDDGIRFEDFFEMEGK